MTVYSNIQHFFPSMTAEELPFINIQYLSHIYVNSYIKCF